MKKAERNCSGASGSLDLFSSFLGLHVPVNQNRRSRSKSPEKHKLLTHVFSLLHLSVFFRLSEGFVKHWTPKICSDKAALNIQMVRWKWSSFLFFIGYYWDSLFHYKSKERFCFEKRWNALNHFWPLYSSKIIFLLCLTKTHHFHCSPWSSCWSCGSVLSSGGRRPRSLSWRTSCPRWGACTRRPGPPGSPARCRHRWRPGGPWQSRRMLSEVRRINSQQFLVLMISLPNLS